MCCWQQQAGFGCKERSQLWKRSIVKVWLIGFAADFAGAALSLALMLLLNTLLDSHIFDPYHFPGATLHAIPGVCLAGWLIWRLNLWEGGYFRGNGRKAESIAGSFYGTLSDDAADVSLKKKTSRPLCKKGRGVFCRFTGKKFTDKRRILRQIPAQSAPF